jgi:hypothetical protein
VESQQEYAKQQHTPVESMSYLGEKQIAFVSESIAVFKLECAITTLIYVLAI